MVQVRGLPFLGAALAALLAAGAAAAAPQKVTTVEGITEYRLDNGARVLLFPDNSRPTVTVNMTVFVGSRHEGYGESGMAHLLEHMVFKGTPTHKHIPRLLQEHGANFNGTTSYDRTNYFETMPAGDANLEFGIRLECDRLVNSYVQRDDLVSEMTVVRNEFERGENSPAAVLGEKITAAAFEWHNYGKTTIGNRSDIERVPINNLQAFYRKFYQPDNVMLIVAGQFDEAKALQYVEKYLGALPRPKRQLDTTYTEEPPQDGERLVTVRRVGDTGLVGLAYHVPAGPHPEFAAVEVLATALSAQPSGRLYQGLVETKKCSSVFASAQALHDPGLLDVMAEVNKGQSVTEVRDLLIQLLEDTATRGVSAEEVERAKRQILKRRELAQADTSRLAVGLSNWAAQGDWRLYFLHRDRVEAVTPAAVQAAAVKYLRQNNRTVGLFLPTKEPERVAVPATPDVKALVENYKGRAAVAQGEAFDVTPAGLAARTQVHTLPEGLKVAILPRKTRGEAVHVQLTLRYGDAESLKGYESAATFLGSLMTHGTKQLTRQQLQDELDKLKATLSSGGGFGGRGGRGGMGGGGGTLGAVTFQAQARRDTLPAVLGLLRQVVREPALPGADFEVMKKARITGLEQGRSEPTLLATRILQRKLAPYPPSDVRYQPTIDEELERLQATTHDQVVKLYQEFIGAQAGELVVVGDCDPDEVLKIVKELTAGWKAAKPYARIPRQAPTLAGGKETVNTPDKANAVYQAAAALAVSDGDPDYPALLLANYVFGGGSLSSRLGDRIRQKEGLSYTVAAMFSADPFDPRASLLMFAICNPGNVGKVETAMREELDKLLKDGVTAEELEKAKQGYLQREQVARTSDAGLAATLANLLHRGRTFAYLSEEDQKIQALTPEQVSAAFRKHIDPKKVVIVTAGDFGAGK